MAVPFTIRETGDALAGIVWLSFIGDIDLAAVPAVRECVATRLADEMTSGVVADLSGVTFLDSSGIGVLVGCRRRADAEGKTFRLAGAHGQVEEVLDLTGVAAFLGAAPSGPDAVAASTTEHVTAERVIAEHVAAEHVAAEHASAGRVTADIE